MSTQLGLWKQKELESSSLFPRPAGWCRCSRLLGFQGKADIQTPPLEQVVSSCLRLL